MKTFIITILGLLALILCWKTLQNVATNTGQPAAVSTPAATTVSQKGAVYSVAEAITIAGFSKWTGTRYVPYMFGDDPSRFRALPEGAQLRVLGDIRFWGLEGLMVPRTSNQFRIISLVNATPNNIQQVECHIDKTEVARFMAHKRSAWKALVHGSFRAVVPWTVPGTPAAAAVAPSKLPKGTPFNEIILEPCFIDRLLDQHYDDAEEE